MCDNAESSLRTEDFSLHRFLLSSQWNSVYEDFQSVYASFGNVGKIVIKHFPVLGGPDTKAFGNTNLVKQSLENFVLPSVKLLTLEENGAEFLRVCTPWIRRGRFGQFCIQWRNYFPGICRKAFPTKLRKK